MLNLTTNQNLVPYYVVSDKIVTTRIEIMQDSKMLTQMYNTYYYIYIYD